MKKTFKLFGIIALVAVIGIFMTACSPEEEEIEEPENTEVFNTYIITGTAGAFTAVKGGETVAGASGVPIDMVLTAINRDAKGEDITVQFGNGAEILNLGTGYTSGSEGVAPTGHPGAIFSGTGWGTVTVTGKVTANRGGYQTNQLASHTVGFIGVNGIINADITNTNKDYSAVGLRTTNNAKYTLTVNGGTITGGSDSLTGYGIAVLDNGVLTVNGGTITGGTGIDLGNNAEAIINGGTVTGLSNSGVYLTRNENKLTVTGGTIKGTGTTAAGIYCSMGGNINLTGTAVITSAADPGANNEGATIVLNNGGNGGADKATLIIWDGVTITNTATNGKQIFNRGNRATVTDNRP